MECLDQRQSRARQPEFSRARFSPGSVKANPAISLWSLCQRPPEPGRAAIERRIQGHIVRFLFLRGFFPALILGVQPLEIGLDLEFLFPLHSRYFSAAK